MPSVAGAAPPPAVPGNTAVLVLGAGRGERLGHALPKAFVPVAGRSLLEWSIRALAEAGVFGRIVPVLAASDFGRFDALGLLGAIDGLEPPVAGGDERQDSMRLGLASLPDAFCWVAVHDAARCLVSGASLRAVIERASSTGAAILAEPARDTIKRVADEHVVETPLRETLWAAQTPQVIRRDWLEAGLAAASAEGRLGTDDAQLVEWLGHPVAIVESTAPNPKITRPEDLILAERLLAARAAEADGRDSDTKARRGMRIGQGYDVHQLAEGRRLVLGGVEVPHDRGLEGHSDGDALLHAVADAILGALGEGDLGRHFPSSDERWRGIASGEILSAVVERMTAAGFRIGNVDATIVAQAPRLSPFQAAMHENLVRLLGTSADRVNVKLTSTDRLGALGRSEGIAGQAVVLLEAI